MYDLLVSIEAKLSCFPTIIITLSVIAVISGWIYTAHRSRALQRRKIAISLLQHMPPRWTESVERLREIFTSSTNYNWTALVEKRYATPVEITKKERKDINAAIIVTNQCEFIAVAILDKTADEKIIKETRRSWFITTYNNLSDFIDELRKKHAPDGEEKDKNMYINFETIVKRWSKPTVMKRLGHGCSVTGNWLI